MSIDGNAVELTKYPFVSIAIITFNSEDTIKECLSSVFEVDYPRSRYEVIIVDAGSRDRTQEIVKKFPVDKLIIEKGASRGRARNICVQEAKGEIVAMIDSDISSSSKDWLAKAVKILEEDPRIAMLRGFDYVPYPSEAPTFIQKVLYFFSLHPSRVLLKEENRGVT